ncbi:LOW QUALITY PROTEIN: phospholipase A1 VesT1.02-like [Aphomia sociella]
MYRDEKRLWPSIVVISYIFQITQCAYLRCYEGSLDNYISVPLENGTALLNSSCIDTTIPTLLYTFGYRGKVGGPATTAVLKAYLKTKKRNVLLLDWEEEAKSGLLGIALGYLLSAVPKAKKVGDTLGGVLVKLVKAGLDPTQIHLLAHSLGAHIMGFAGRKAREQGNAISRITGLDPAGNLFEGPFAQKGLDRTCATFVDIIHTDPGGYGTTESTGTVDIWPNYSGNDKIQPGCPVGDFEMFSSEDLCSHDRSWQYFVEAIAFPTAFPAASAADYESWINDDNITETIYLGDLTNTRARGNFYLSTNSESLYGKGVAGLRPSNQTRER